jgi:hypothetical protein
MAKNILFEYLYRDAGNWKQYGQAVFTNIGESPLANIEAQIRAALHDGQWFLAEKIDLETQFIGDHNTDDDHPWHEFDKVSETNLSPSDPAFIDGPRRDIAQFIRAMQAWHQMGWSADHQLCCVCNGPFTEEEWEDRHDLHKLDCPRTKTAGKQTFGEVFCDCNLVCHARCCPSCDKGDSEIQSKAAALLFTSVEDAKSTIRFVSMDVLEAALAHAEEKRKKSLAGILRTEIRQRKLGKRVQL